LEIIKKNSNFFQHIDLWKNCENNLQFGERRYENIIKELTSKLKEERERSLYLEGILTRKISNLESMISFLKLKSSEIDQIDSVFISYEDNVCVLWFIANSLDEKTEELVFDLVYDLLGEFNNFKIDFRLLIKKDNLKLPDNLKRIV